MPMLTDISVLVVDDNSSTVELICQLLKQHGARVNGVLSVEEGLACLKANPPDVIISDLMMPKEDGFSFIRKLRAMSPDDGGQIPAIAITADASKDSRVGLLTSGFQAFILKPFDPLELVLMIKSWVGH